MGLLDRYLLRIKRPAPNDFAAVHENLREIERHTNALPVPAPRIIPFAGGAIAGNVTVAVQESFSFATARPNTVIVIELFVDAEVGAAGFGTAFFYAYLDATAIDTTNYAALNQAAVRAGIGTAYVTTIPTPGNHTLELWAKTTIAAGTANYDQGRFLLWVL